MKQLGLILVGFIVVGCFAAFGYLYPENPSRDTQIESVVAFGAIGLGAAFYLVIGIPIVRRARSGRSKKLWATCQLFGCAVLSCLMSLAVIDAAAWLTRSARPGELSLFFGEHFLWIVLVVYRIRWIAGFGFVLFTACLFLPFNAVAPQKNDPGAT